MSHQVQLPIITRKTLTTGISVGSCSHSSGGSIWEQEFC